MAYCFKKISKYQIRPIVTIVTYHSFYCSHCCSERAAGYRHEQKSLPSGKPRTEIITILSLLSLFLYLSSDCDHLAIYVLLMLGTSSVQARRVQRNQMNKRQKLLPEEQYFHSQVRTLRFGHKYLCYPCCL